MLACSLTRPLARSQQALNDADTKHNYSKVVCPSCNTTTLRGEKIAQLALQAGVNSNCGSFMGTYMPGVMARRLVDLATLHASTARLLAVRFKLGLFEPRDALLPAIPVRGLDAVDSPAHRALALKQARQAIVLLQNRIPSSRTHRRSGTHMAAAAAPAAGDDSVAAAAAAAPLLPLTNIKVAGRSSLAGLKVAMIGPNANASLNLLSGYHGTPPPDLLVSPLHAMAAALGAAAGGGGQLRYAVGCNMTNASWGGIGGGAPGRPPPGAPAPPTHAEAMAHIAEAVEAAAWADVAVVGLGLCGDNYVGGNSSTSGGPAKQDSTCYFEQETETTDRLSLRLPGWQLPLLQAVAASGTPVVLFVINAGPVDLSWAKEHVDAIVSAGYGGEYGGQALADVLTGAYNPGGALPYTAYTQVRLFATCSYWCFLVLLLTRDYLLYLCACHARPTRSASPRAHLTTRWR